MSRPGFLTLNSRFLGVLVSVVILIVAVAGTGFGAEEWEYYLVSKGDTLYSLAKASGTSVEGLMALNNLNSNDIRVGDLLKLPIQTGSGANAVLTGVENPKFNLSVAAVSVGISLSSLPEKRLTEQPAVKFQNQEKPVEKIPERPVQKPILTLTTEEKALLAKLVMAEARGEPFEGKVAVAAVVLNRTKHPSFPSTVREVIMEPGQFLSVENGMIKIAADEGARMAVEKALWGEDPSGGALFFYNPRKSKALAWWQTRTITAVIGDHNFAI